MALTKEQKEALLSKLTKEEKLAYFSALEEKQRRMRNKKALYVPNAGQLPIHKSDASIRLVLSGNGAGKTTAAVHEVIWAALGTNPIKNRRTKVPCDIGVVLDKPDKADSVWLPEMRKWFEIKASQLHKKGKPSTSQITFDNGSTITFFSHDMDPLTFESIQLDYVAYDEPPPRNVFIALRRATRKPGTKPWHLIIGTPLAQSWLRSEIWEPYAKGELPEAECFKVSSEVNKANINWEEQEKNFKFMSEAERAVRKDGSFFDTSGLALAHLFRRDIHVVEKIEWDKICPAVLIMDPHPSKAHVALVIGADRHNQLYALAEYERKSTARQFIRELIKEGWWQKYHFIDILYDSLGSGDTTSGEGFKSFGEVVNEELKREGYGRARATTYSEKDDEDWVERIREVLSIPEEKNNFGKRTPKLLISKDCYGLIHNIENASWYVDRTSKENKPKIDLRKLDYLACLKYGLATNLYFSKKKDKAYYVSKPVYGLSTPSQRRSTLKYRL